MFFYVFRNPSKTLEGSWVTPKWPLHTAYGKEFLTLDTNNTSIGVGPRLEQCAFWKNYIPDVVAISSKLWIILQLNENDKPNKSVLFSVAESMKSDKNCVHYNGGTKSNLIELSLWTIVMTTAVLML